LRRLAQDPNEGAAHPAAIRKSGLPGDHVDWMTRLLHENACRFDPHGLDGFCRRLPSLLAKCAGKLTGAQVSCLCKFCNRQRSM
jgi:hypothetical protein